MRTRPRLAPHSTVVGSVHTQACVSTWSDGSSGHDAATAPSSKTAARSIRPIGFPPVLTPGAPEMSRTSSQRPSGETVGRGPARTPGTQADRVGRSDTTSNMARHGSPAPGTMPTSSDASGSPPAINALTGVGTYGPSAQRHVSKFSNSAPVVEYAISTKSPPSRNGRNRSETVVRAISARRPDAVREATMSSSPRWYARRPPPARQHTRRPR